MSDTQNDPGEWLSMGEAARRAKTERTMFRRRMELLNARHGGELLRPVGVGKKRKRFEVHSKALLFYSRVDVEWRDAEMQQMRSDLEETQQRLDQLRNTTLEFRRKALDWFKKHGK